MLRQIDFFREEIEAKIRGPRRPRPRPGRPGQEQIQIRIRSTSSKLTSSPL